MLSAVEVKVLDCVYSPVRYYSSLIPLGWEDGKMILRPTTRRTQMLQIIVTCLVLSEIIMCIIQVMSLKDKGDVNEIILQIIFLTRPAALLVLRLNIWIFSTQLVKLINQCSNVNSKWGERKFLDIK